MDMWVLGGLWLCCSRGAWLGGAMGGWAAKAWVMWGGAQRGTTAARFPYYYSADSLPHCEYSAPGGASPGAAPAHGSRWQV